MEKGPATTYRLISVEALVNQLEPDRNTKPELRYPDIRVETRKKYLRPEQPGRVYGWAEDIIDD